MYIPSVTDDHTFHKFKFTSNTENQDLNFINNNSTVFTSHRGFQTIQGNTPFPPKTKSYYTIRID